jgi:hypothetical protein
VLTSSQKYSRITRETAIISQLTHHMPLFIMDAHGILEINGSNGIAIDNPKGAGEQASHRLGNAGRTTGEARATGTVGHDRTLQCNAAAAYPAAIL